MEPKPYNRIEVDGGELFSCLFGSKLADLTPLIDPSKRYVLVPLP